MNDVYWCCFTYRLITFSGNIKKLVSHDFQLARVRLFYPKECTCSQAVIYPLSQNQTNYFSNCWFLSSYALINPRKVENLKSKLFFTLSISILSTSFSPEMQWGSNTMHQPERVSIWVLNIHATLLIGMLSSNASGHVNKSLYEFSPGS